MIRLVGISKLLEKPKDMEDGLREVADLTANTLKTQRCSIMLLADEDETSSQTALRVFTHYGNLPPSAYEKITPLNEGIAGYVAATGKRLLIKNIRQSQFASVARYFDDDGNQSLISVPITLSEKVVVGVINVSFPLNRKSFSNEDLQLLETFALFVGKSLQLSQLQLIMRSKFIELAVVRDLTEQNWQKTITVHPDPSKLAKIVAKSFFKELTQAEFSPNQIIAIATEVLNLLQNDLTRHKKRLGRDDM